MTQPVPYVPSFNFTNWQTNNPTLPQPGVNLDAQFNALQTTTDQVRTNLALIQRDDGALANGSVGSDQLAAGIITSLNAAIASFAGLAPPSAWVTLHVYAVGDSVWVSNSKLYRCAIAHTSGVFATDLAAVKWVLVNDFTNSNFAVAGGTGNALTATPSPAISGYTDGLSLLVRITAANIAGAMTINVSGLGNKSVFSQAGVNPAAGAMQIGSDELLVYNSVLGAFVALTLRPSSGDITDASASGISVLTGTAAAGRTALGVAIGSNVQAWDGDLDAISALGTTGFAARLAANNWAHRNLVAPAAGFTITNPAGTAGDPTFVLANDLAALEALSTNNAFPVRTGADTYVSQPYVEGTWVPVPSLQTVLGSSWATTTALGFYTRVGRMVTVWFNLDSVPTISTGTGLILISGLPFAPANVELEAGAIAILEGASYPAGRSMVVLTPLNATSLILSSNGTAATAAGLQHTEITTGVHLKVRGSLTYQV